ncbi:MAG: thermonuclease family protein [Rhodospirillaceae bacterium]|nr:thermonuclease family protein [Rhodospirillaceae bacterium]
MHTFKFLLALLFVAVAPAFAAPPDALQKGDSGVVAAVVDGDTVRLKEGRLKDGAADIRLIGMQAPKLPLGRKGFKTWPLADDAKDALEKLVLNRDVTVRFGTVTRDRNGRTLGHLVRSDGLWIQGEMLRQGMARVYTFPDNRKLAGEMLALEAEARKAKRGIWAHPFYAVRDAASPSLSDDKGTYQIVAGTVKDTAKTKDRIYVNFGDDFRSDFTIAIEKRDWKIFEGSNVDLLALKNKTVEVRGWITMRNGPMIEATHPEQVAMQ